MQTGEKAQEGADLKEPPSSVTLPGEGVGKRETRAFGTQLLGSGWHKRQSIRARPLPPTPAHTREHKHTHTSTRPPAPASPQTCGASPLPPTPISPPGLYRGRELGLTFYLAPLFTPLGAGHQGAQEEEEGCREAEPAHLQGLAGGLLRMAGRQGFSQPS